MSFPFFHRNRSYDGKSEHGEEHEESASRKGGNTTTSLLKKYGACEKVAIGRGATAVVRLAHKWDKSTEKLYAVKVRSGFLQRLLGLRNGLTLFADSLSTHTHTGVPQAAQERERERLRQEAHLRVLHLVHPPSRQHRRDRRLGAGRESSLV